MRIESVTGTEGLDVVLDQDQPEELVEAVTDACDDFAGQREAQPGPRRSTARPVPGAGI